MKPGASKHKGNAFENYCKKAIQNAIGHEVILCRKTFGSGSQPDDKGDLVVGKYMIECKFHKKITEGKLKDWWRKIFLESNYDNKIPVLIYKENRKGINVKTFEFGKTPIITINLTFIEFLRKLNEEYKK